jgi:hypothetical protein
MDQVTLKDISSISRIHRASSLAIFTYHFRRYHCCKYNSFILWTHNYSTTYPQIEQSIRPNYHDRFALLKFHSIAIDAPLNDRLYLQQCLFTCTSLRVINIDIFCEIWKAWKPVKIKSTIKELIFLNGPIEMFLKYQIRLRGVNTAFPDIEKLRVTNLVSYRTIAIKPSRQLTIDRLGMETKDTDFPPTLESLIIERMSNGARLNVANLSSLRELIIRGLDGEPANIDLPDSLERLKLPPFFLMNKQKLPRNLIWFSCGYDDGRLIMPSNISPGYFMNTNIRELHLWGFTIPWWNKFEVPPRLESIACSYWNLSTICKRVKLFKCSLKYVVLAIGGKASIFQDFIAGQSRQEILSWVCSDKITINQIRDKKNKKFQWFMIPIDEFGKINNALTFDAWHYLDPFRLEI